MRAWGGEPGQSVANVYGIESRASRRPRVALIVRRNAETRARAIIARRSARIGSARMWMSIDSLDRSARSRRSPTPNEKAPEGTVGLEMIGVRRAPAAGALGAVHVLDAGEGHGEGSGGHGFGV